LGAAAVWLGRGYLPEDGFGNPCLSPLPPELRENEWVRAAWEGLDPSMVWDVHVHVAGLGEGGSGIRIHPHMDEITHPILYVQKKFYLDAACTEEMGQIDAEYVRRLLALAADFPPGCRLLAYAMDAYHHPDGRRDISRTALYVPDAWVMRLARAHPERLGWVASIHPYRRDAVEALDRAVANGAVAVKWLPSTMGMDPASPRCDAFYASMARHDLPLICHTGTEWAVVAAGNGQDLNNPLRLRRPLEQGVRVVAAHCASLGWDADLDKGPNGPTVRSFQLFARLMDDPDLGRRMFGDLSAMPQFTRLSRLAQVLERTEWHDRLLNGSDYPLPGIYPIYSARFVAGKGLIEPAAVPVLRQVRRYNPLLFDFLLKRLMRRDGRAFPASVFETARFFRKAGR
jgi:mannonate dehydratase